MAWTSGIQNNISSATNKVINNIVNKATSGTPMTDITSANFEDLFSLVKNA